MSILEKRSDSRAAPTGAAAAVPAFQRPAPHRWTVEEYQKISDVGLLKDQRTELADGEIVDMAAQNDPHIVAVSKGTRVLMAVYDEEHYWVTIQATTRLGSNAAREPDMAVREGPPRDQGNAPVRPLLVIEVSDTTLLYDQIVKGSLYASRSIADYWVVNLIDLRIKVYRNPVEDPTQEHGWRYDSCTVHWPPEFIVPLCKPDARIEVARFLP